MKTSDLTELKWLADQLIGFASDLIDNLEEIQERNMLKKNRIQNWI